MSDRGIFVLSFLTVVLIVAGAFALPQFFFFDLFKSAIFIGIGVMVFFGENQYSYMLGILAPPLWYIVDIVLGGFFFAFGGLFAYLAGKQVPPLETPLHGLAIVSGILLVVFCYRAWKKEVTEPFFGKTFRVCLGISIVYVVILAAWYALGIAGSAA